MVGTRIIQELGEQPQGVGPLGEIPPKEAFERLIGDPVEACADYRGAVVPCEIHPFVGAVHAAFVDHRGLVLSPDMFWLLITQGFARHVNRHAEAFRHLFVSHSGQREIRIRRDDFVKGSPENPWAEVFHQFSAAIRTFIGEAHHSRIVTHFSTTGPVEKAANEVVLMGAMKNYFRYVVQTRCGIPRILLEGTVADWKQLRESTEQLGFDYGLEWWTSRLLPHLEAVVRSASGSDEASYWANLYKWCSVSGGDEISGWLTDFFPYLLDWKNNEVVNWTLSGERTQPREAYPIGSLNLPGGLSQVPFIWEYFGQTFSMEFLAGFSAVTQDANDYSVRPKIGWAMREMIAKPRSED